MAEKTAKKMMSWDQWLTIFTYYSLSVALVLGILGVVLPRRFPELDFEPMDSIVVPLVHLMLALIASYRKYFKLFLLMLGVIGLLQIWQSLQGLELMGGENFGQPYMVYHGIFYIMFLVYSYFSDEIRKEFKVLEPCPPKPRWYSPVWKILWVLVFAFVGLLILQLFGTFSGFWEQSNVICE